MRPFLVVMLALELGAMALEAPRLDSRVTDTAHVLSSSDVARLEDTLRAYEQQTGHQFAVLTVPSLEGDTIENYAVHVFEQWKLGDAKRNDGLLLVVAVNDHKMRIEVGYGLEGAIPDVTAARIIREFIVPRFKTNDFSGGIFDAMDALMKAGRGEALGPPRSSAPRESPMPLVVILGIMMLFLRFMPAGVRIVFGGFVGTVVAGALEAKGLLLGLPILGCALLGWLVGLGARRRRAMWVGGGGSSSDSWTSSSSSSDSWSSGGGGWSSGDSGGSSGGDFSGGGGSSGGGGASGDW